MLTDHGLLWKCLCKKKKGKSTRNYEKNAFFFNFISICTIFEFRVFLIKKLCQFLCLVLVSAA